MNQVSKISIFRLPNWQTNLKNSLIKKNLNGGKLFCNPKDLLYTNKSSDRKSDLKFFGANLNYFNFIYGNKEHKEKVNQFSPSVYFIDLESFSESLISFSLLKAQNHELVKFYLERSFRSSLL